MRRVIFTTGILAVAVAAMAQVASVGSGPAQDAANALRTFAGTDAAFIVQGSISERVDKGNLATLLRFPNDEVMTLKLTGAQVQQALERSISLYPQSNQSFLYISGFEAKFNPNAPPNNRIVSVTLNGAPLDNAKTYTVAMASSLARGTLGYFKIWKMSDVTRTIEGKTIEDALRGKPATGSPSHWSVP